MYSWNEDYPCVCLKYCADLVCPWAGFVLCSIRGPESASVFAQCVPHCVHAFGMLWLCLCERTASSLEAVVWLHVKYMSALLLSCLLTLSYLPLFRINLFYVTSGIYCCICSDLVIRFHITWNSTCYCTGVVHVSAHTSEQGLICLFLFYSPPLCPPFLSPRTPGDEWSVLEYRLVSLCPASRQRFLFMMDTGMKYYQLTWFR